MDFLEPFDDLSVEKNSVDADPIPKIRKTPVRAPPAIPKPIPDMSSKDVKAVSKMLENKKKADDPHTKSQRINRIDKYIKKFPNLVVDKSYEKKKYEMTDEQLQMVENGLVFQLSEAVQFDIGKKIFCDLICQIPVRANSAFQLGYCIDNLPQKARERYDNVIEPTWAEIIIKYNLFATGPELRLLLLMSQMIQEVDLENRNRLHQQVNVAQQRMKKANEKFKDL